MKIWIASIALLAAVCTGLAGCSTKPPESIAKTDDVVVTVVVTVPVVQTRVVIATREVPRTVVVTATPVPTPTYESRVNLPADVLAYALSTDPLALGPQGVTDEGTTLVVQQLYDGLFNLRGDGIVEPAAATDYKVSDDGTVYTVTLRSGMTWSDGAPVTAQHYVDGICRTLEPAVGDSYYYLLSDVARIKGAKDFASGDLADCKKVGVKAVDDLTLRIELEQPASFLAKLLAFRTFLPARLDLLQHAATISGTLPFVGNGPYVLAEWVPKDHITLTKNPNYWNASAVGFQQIQFKIIPKLAEQLASYEKGDLQVAEFPAEETQRIEADPGFAEELNTLVRPGTSYIGLNTESGPTKNLALRRAIASAIDRDWLINNVLKQPWHAPAQVVIPPNTPGYQGNDPSIGYRYDPDAVKKFLAEAGYGPGKPVPPVEIWTNREGNNELVFRAISDMLEQAGIPTRFSVSKWPTYLASLDACNKPNRSDATKTPAECSYNLYRMGWVMDYADAASILTILGPKSTFQYTGWQSKEYEDIMKQALAEPDEAKRIELYRQAEEILLNDVVAVVPLQHYDRTVLVKQGVKSDFPPFGPPNLQYWKPGGQ